MKGSCGLVASVFAASTAALASSSSSGSAGDISFAPCCCEGYHSATPSRSADAANSQAANQDKFSPRFDGLRFIETLITAHR